MFSVHAESQQATQTGVRDDRVGRTRSSLPPFEKGTLMDFLIDALDVLGVVVAVAVGVAYVYLADRMVTRR